MFSCSLQEFFLTVKDMTRCSSDRTQISYYQKWGKDELELNKKFIAAKDSVHASLCGKKECLMSLCLKSYHFPIIITFIIKLVP
jgi:hypothetical protein